MRDMNVIRKDTVLRNPTTSHEDPYPVKSVVIRLSDTNGKEHFTVNGDNLSKRYGSNLRFKWSYWFKYLDF